MQIVHCAGMADLPSWITSAAREVSEVAFDEDAGALVVLCRRDDGEVQAIPEGHLDAEVIESLMMWAASRK